MTSFKIENYNEINAWDEYLINFFLCFSIN
jgi:hypothetical protein